MPQERLSSRSPVRRMCNNEMITIKKTQILEMQIPRGNICAKCECSLSNVSNAEMSEDESEEIDNNSSQTDDSLDEKSHTYCIQCNEYLPYNILGGTIPEPARYHNKSDQDKNAINQLGKKFDRSFEDKCKTDKLNNLITVLISGTVIFAFLGYGYQVLEDMNKISISDLHNAFPSQPKQTFKDIETIINDVLKVDPIHPAVFLFLYKYDSPKFSKFLESIAKFASGKLNVKEPHIVLEEKNYINPEVHKDYGYLIHKYKPKLDSRKVMVIQNLHHMPGKTAQALHSFCDEFTPLTDRAVYILTLQVDSFDGVEMRIAEGRLRSVWSDLDPDLLEPLITRVTSTVMKFY